MCLFYFWGKGFLSPQKNVMKKYCSTIKTAKKKHHKPSKASVGVCLGLEYKKSGTT